jgi:cytochrome c
MASRFRLHLVPIVTLATALATAAGCAGNRVAQAEQLTGGRASEGRHLIYSYGCGSCHIIPGISEATGTVGPPLRGFASRDYIAGVLVNRAPNLFRWLREPQGVDPGNAMPNLGITDQQARDMAAYLYTLH